MITSLSIPILFHNLVHQSLQNFWSTEMAWGNMIWLQANNMNLNQYLMTLVKKIGIINNHKMISAIFNIHIRSADFLLSADSLNNHCCSLNIDICSHKITTPTRRTKSLKINSLNISPDYMTSRLFKICEFLLNCTGYIARSRNS